MKIVICGATGFIGRNMTEWFARQGGHEIIATHFSREPFACDGVQFRKVDLTNAREVDALLDGGADLVIAAAATTSGAKDIVAKPYIHVTDNAVMNSLLFRGCHDHSVKRVIFFSCTVMYPTSETPLKESDFNPEAIYEKYFGAAWTKVYLERMCEFYAKFGRTQYTAIRHTNIYGPYDKYDLEKSHVFGATVTKVMKAKDNKVVIWGEGTEKRDLLHVDDLMSFVQAAIEKQEAAYELYNCGYGSCISIKDLVHKIVAISGKPLSIEHDLSKPSLKTSLTLDCSKAEEALGWRRQLSLEQGIEKTLSWYQENVC